MYVQKQSVQTIRGIEYLGAFMSCLESSCKFRVKEKYSVPVQKTFKTYTMFRRA